MKHGKYYVHMLVCFFMLMLIALSFTTATYAWFTSNSMVKTDRVSSRSATDTVQLLLGESEGSLSEEKEVAITRVNETPIEELMPVSTADLKHFVYNDCTVDNAAVHFIKTEDLYFYHGRVYIKAAAENHGENEKLALYLDQSEELGSLFQNDTGELLGALRLGLIFDGEAPIILRAGEESKGETDRKIETVINGVKLGENQVIDSAGDSLMGVDDPSLPITDYIIDDTIGMGEEGRKPLIKMDLNRPYCVDIYVYLEGCDPDCSDVSPLGEIDFHLAFYGNLVGEDD